MAIVNISVDTNARQAVLTVDGQIVPIIAIHLNKGTDFDGIPFLRLSYVIEVQNNDSGLMERHEFFLADPDDEAVFASTKDGLASRTLKNGEIINDQAMSDTIRFMQNRKTQK